MAAHSKKKLGAGGIVGRVIALVLISVIVGVGTFTGSRAFFLNRMRKQQQEEIAADLKAESQARVDVALLRMRDAMTIRIYHNKNKEMIFIPLRNDTLLTLNTKGQKAYTKKTGQTVKKARIKDFTACTNSIKLIKAQIENTFDITIPKYESVGKKLFSQTFNKSGRIKLTFDKPVAYEDQNKMIVHISTGTHTMNGNQAAGLVLDNSQFDNYNDHMEIVGDLLTTWATALNKLSLSEYQTILQGYYVDANSNISYSAEEKTLQRIHTIKKKNFTYQVLDGKTTTYYDAESPTKQSTNFTVNKAEVDDLFNDLLSEGGMEVGTTASKSAKKKTTTAGKNATTEKGKVQDSKNLVIEVQNSTDIPGLGGKWKEKLNSEGYNMGPLSNNRDGVLTHTKIIVSKKGQGSDLEDYFKNPEVVVGTNDSGADICIIIGSEDQL